MFFEQTILLVSAQVCGKCTRCKKSNANLKEYDDNDGVFLNISIASASKNCSTWL